MVSQEKSPLQLEFIPVDYNTELKLPLFTSRVEAGFPSPADDYIEDKLDLNELLIQHPAATFFVRVSGSSMEDIGIHSNDILIVDRSIDPKDQQVVIAVIDGELTVKRIRITEDDLYLMPENEDFAPIQITEEMDFETWGVVTHVIHSFPT